MAIRLPTTSLQIRKANFIRGEPIRSGADAAADWEYGFTGAMSAEANHQYAYLTQCLGFCRRHDNGAIAINAGVWADAVGPLKIELGADVAYVAVMADIADGEMKVIVDAASNTSTAPIGARALDYVVVTLADATGVSATITIQIQVNVTNCILYGIEIYEVEMVAGDFP